MKRSRLNRRQIVTNGTVLAVAAALLLVFHGLTPFAVGNSVIQLMAVGRVECGSVSPLAALSTLCPVVGGPLGGLYATNLPIIALASLLAAVFAVPSAWALAFAFYATFILSMWAVMQLLRRLNIRPWLALVGAIGFGASTPVALSIDYGGMTAGVLLLPVLILAALAGFDAIEQPTRQRTPLVLAGWLVVACLLLFSDGYTFMMATFACGVAWLVRAWRQLRRRSTWLGGLAFAGVSGTAFGLYRLTVPNAGAWGAEPIDVFRAYGLDLATLVVPTYHTWWADLLGIGIPRAPMWGAGGVTAHNYLGIILLVLAIIGLIWHPRMVRRDVFAFALAGLGAIILALGPSLKIAAFYDPAISAVITQMPPGAALIDFPWGGLFEKLPGLQYMRAIYRWVILAHVAVLVLAAVGVEALLRRRRVTLAATLGVLAVVEVATNPIAAISDNRDRAAAINDFDTTVLRPMDEAIDADATVVFVNDAVPKHNDYLATYLAPSIGVTSWNIGNDKALRRARQAWPVEIETLIADDFDESSLDAAELALREGLVTDVVVTYFDMRNAASEWPPPSADIARGIEISNAFEADPRFSVSVFDTFSLVTLAD